MQASAHRHDEIILYSVELGQHALRSQPDRDLEGTMAQQYYTGKCFVGFPVASKSLQGNLISPSRRRVHCPKQAAPLLQATPFSQFFFTNKSV